MNFVEIASKKNSIDSHMTFEETLAALGKMFDIELAPDEGHGRRSLAVEYEPAWAIGARLSITRDVDPASFHEEREFFRMRIEVSFSSSHFTPAEARARAILISHVADMACFAEACVSNLRWDRDGQPMKFDYKNMKWS